MGARSADGGERFLRVGKRNVWTARGGCLNIKKEIVIRDATQKELHAGKAKYGLPLAFQYSRISVEIHHPVE